MGQLNKKGQRFGFGIWKSTRDFESKNIKTIFGEWEYDDLLNGQILYNKGAPKCVGPHGVKQLNFMQTAVKVGFLKEYKLKKEERDKKH